jgi:hypothetical protein
MTDSSLLTFSGGYASIMPDFVPVLAGFKQGRPGSLVDEPLEANAILLQSPGGRILFVQLDVMSVGQAFRQGLMDRLKGRLQDGELFLVASHTHYAPNIDPRLTELGITNDEYCSFVVATVGELVERVLAATRQPVSLRYGESQANHSMNRRRWCLAPSSHFPFLKRVMALHPNPSGPRDERIRMFVAAAEAADAPPAGVLWQYACHPVTTCPANAVSSDYPGAVRRALRDRFRPDLPVVFLPGLSGNIRPSRIVHFPSSPYYLLHRLINGPVFGDFDLPSSKRWRTTLADAALRAMSPPLRPIEASKICAGRLAVPLVDLMEGDVDDRPMVFHMVNIDPSLTFLGISAEPVVEYAAALGDLFPQRMFVPVGYIGALVGYLPTSEMLRDGGLEVVSPCFGLDRAQYRQNVSQLVHEMVGKLSASVSRSGSALENTQS